MRYNLGDCNCTIMIFYIFQVEDTYVTFVANRMLEGVDFTSTKSIFAIRKQHLCVLIRIVRLGRNGEGI